MSHIITVIPYTCKKSFSSVHLVYSLHQWSPTWFVFDTSGHLCLTFFFIVTQIGSILEKGPSKVPRRSDQSLGQSLLCSCIIWQSGQFGNGSGSSSQPSHRRHGRQQRRLLCTGIVHRCYFLKYCFFPNHTVAVKCSIISQRDIFLGSVMKGKKCLVISFF